MIKLYEGEEECLLIPVEEWRRIVVCANVLKKPIVQIIELKNGMDLIVNQSRYLSIKMYGYMYLKENKDIEIKSYIENDEEIMRVALVDNFFNKRIIEIIEFKDGQLLVSSVSRFVNIDYISSEEVLQNVVSK